ncbi:MAG: alkyldihydroxyacetonephosphate synthase [Hyphomicrobiaceae bacterium]|jgi:alkyldihydroxyacetonephosphate synthase
MSETRRRKFWGWGWEDEFPEAEQRRKIAELLGARFEVPIPEEQPIPTLASINLPKPRIAPPAALADYSFTDPFERASHTYGKAFRDIVRAFRRDFSAAPDFVVTPPNEEALERTLEWCTNQRVAAIPYGGGSSVCAGVEGRNLDDYAGVVSLDLRRFDKILEIDRTSRAARIQGGIFGPALEDGLRPQGLTLRHYPQSFEFSTLGGWIATRSGGHYATQYTHIDEFVESLRMITPAGAWESRRLPGSGAGTSPDRMAIGSEGILGIVTEAWMRLQDRPRLRASAAVRFDDFYEGAEAVRAIGQSGLNPSNLRLVDAGEALMTGAGDGSTNLLLVGFESADHALDAWIKRALEICRDFGGSYPEDAVRTRSDNDAGPKGATGATGAWRDSFLRAPYLRDSLVALGFISETFETAVTWDQFRDFHRGMRNRIEDALARICGGGAITCRFTHVYPDGPAPYFTIMAPSRAASQLEQWDEIKAVSMDAIVELGGTITHHHAVGRDHRPGYDRQRPDLFARALRAAKRELDPAGILNPGVLIDP